jgi:hypothetical protein
MTEIEVLTECLKKVKQSGWDAYKSTYCRVYQRESGHLMVEFFTDVQKPPVIVSYEEVVFSYSFAEHFWGMDTMYFVAYSDNAPGMQGDVIGWKTDTNPRSGV